MQLGLTVIHKLLACSGGTWPFVIAWGVRRADVGPVPASVGRLAARVAPADVWTRGAPEPAISLAGWAASVAFHTGQWSFLGRATRTPGTDEPRRAMLVRNRTSARFIGQHCGRVRQRRGYRVPIQPIPQLQRHAGGRGGPCPRSRVPPFWCGVMCAPSALTCASAELCVRPLPPCVCVRALCLHLCVCARSPRVCVRVQTGGTSTTCKSVTIAGVTGGAYTMNCPSSPSPSTAPSAARAPHPSVALSFAVVVVLLPLLRAWP